VPEPRLVEMLGLKAGGKQRDSAAAQVREAVDRLNADYQAQGRAFRVQRLAGGWQLLTLPEFGPLLARVRGLRAQGRLTPAALETLAIIAYRQPILRAELEAIRGVACGEVLKTLLERRLVRITGRAEELGRPMLYGTTTEFLKVFGLARIEDLPKSQELKAPRT
jgi:segregation and condensation protein B